MPLCIVSVQLLYVHHCINWSTHIDAYHFDDIYIIIYIHIWYIFIYDTTQFVYQYTLSIRAVAPGSPKTCRARRGRGYRGPQEICALVGPGVTCHWCNFQKGRNNRTKIVVNNDGKLLFFFCLSGLIAWRCYQSWDIATGCCNWQSYKIVFWCLFGNDKCVDIN